MLNGIISVITGMIPKVVSSTIVNGYLGLKSYFTGTKSAAEASVNSTQGVARDAGYEFARVGLNQAAAFVPGGNIAQTLVRAGADMTVNGVRAGVEGRDVARTVAKNGFYAVNTAVAGPLLAFPLNFATDYMVDKGAEKMEFAYNNYRNGQSQVEYQMKNRNTVSALSTEVIDDEDLGSFISIAPAA